MNDDLEDRLRELGTVDVPAAAKERTWERIQDVLKAQGVDREADPLQSPSRGTGEA